MIPHWRTAFLLSACAAVARPGDADFAKPVPDAPRDLKAQPPPPDRPA